MSTPRSALLRCFLAVAFAVTVSPRPASGQVPSAPFLQASVSGQTVTASWNAVPGALSYRVEAGLTPTQVLYARELGNITSFSIPGVPEGTYYLRVLSRNLNGLSTPSNVVALTVTSAQAPPAPPSGLSVSVAGTTATFTVQVPSGATGLLLLAGVAPGATSVALPMSLTGPNSVPNIPPGVYYARMVATNAGGPSGASNEVQVVVTAPTCSAPAATTVTSQVSNQNVSFSWTPVAGASAYRLDASATPGGAPLHSQPFGAQSTSVAYGGVPPGVYYVKVTAANACGQASTSPEVTVTVTPPPPPPPGSNRTPNPPAPTPPNYLRLPNRSAVVEEMARLYPAELRASCVETGGNNRWLFRVVERLRREDTRWGLNWKRARVGDMSQDVITYNYGPQADEGTLYVHVVDVIAGHCGSNPNAAWIDQTVLWSTGAKWTLQPYIQAGFPQ